MSEKTKTEPGASGLQREASGVEAKKAELRKQIEGIRRGHTTGGYCDTEALHVAEKALWKILSPELEAAKEKHGYSPDPKFKHPSIRALELEINGLSWKPELVVKHE